MILSLQGCMAVGKTTAITYLKEHAPYLHISYENIGEVLREVKERQLNKDIFEDYIEIQRLWILHERKRWEKAKDFPTAVMDFGAEEIEFYTLHYPKAIGKNWPVKEALRKELASLEPCMPNRILFLDASQEHLQRNKEKDTSRSRNSFEFYLRNLFPLKRQWFLNRDNVDILSVDGLSKEEVGKRVQDWCDACLHRYK